MKDTIGVVVSMKAVVDRAKSPDYNQVTGHVKNEVALEFKAFCARERLSISEAMDLALSLFLATYQDKKKFEKELKDLRAQDKT